MSLIKSLIESDEEHARALASTGFWGNAGAGAIIIAKDTGRILMPFRSKHVQEPNTWGTWGGAIDQGEDPEKAALREIKEECGYSGRVLDIEHLYRFEKGSFRYDTYALIIQEEFKPKLDWETEKAEWMDEWPKPLHFGLKSVIDHAAQKIGKLTNGGFSS